MVETSYWDGKRLKELMERTGVTQAELSKHTDLSLTSISMYILNKTQPGLTALVQMADYFSVPLDYFAGRMPLEIMASFYNNFSDRFKALRHAAYEEYLKPGRTMAVEPGYYATWPYNLFDSIFFDRPDLRNKLLTASQQKKLEEAIDTLGARSKEMIQMYFRDEIGITLMARKYNVSPTYIENRLARLIKELRTPARLQIILDAISEPEEKEKSDCAAAPAVDFDNLKQEVSDDALISFSIPEEVEKSGADVNLFETLIPVDVCRLQLKFPDRHLFEDGILHRLHDTIYGLLKLQRLASLRQNHLPF